MKFLNTLLLSLFTTGLVLAAPPKNHRSDRYKDLYLRSAITDPPPVKEKEVEVNDLPDWVLVGVTKYIGRTQIEIMNIKDRRRLVIPSKPASEEGFSIKKVVQDRNYLDNTVVTLQKGKTSGEVRFDRKFLVLKKVAAPSGGTARRTAANGRTVAGKTGTRQPPTPGRTVSRTRTGTSTPTRPGAVPRPSTSTNGRSSSGTTTNSTNSTNSTGTTSSRRTRYVPRPTK